MDWCFYNSSLTVLNLFGNPIRSPPKYLCDDIFGNKLKLFIKDLRRGSQHPSHIQLFLVGHGGAGKTTFKQRILLQQPCLNTGIVLFYFIYFIFLEIFEY